MDGEIAIIDCGRGPQLSTSRITVQDLFPYFQWGYSNERIIGEAMPSLSAAEIDAVRRYVDEHREEVLEEDLRIRERNANRKNSPEVEAILRQGRQKVMERLEALRNHRDEASNAPGRLG